MQAMYALIFHFFILDRFVYCFHPSHTIIVQHPNYVRMRITGNSENLMIG